MLRARGYGYAMMAPDYLEIQNVALQKYFKYSSFRPGQLETLLPLIHGRHEFARGAGKSLCMFLAPSAIGESAVGAIISPLSALMDQQV